MIITETIERECCVQGKDLIEYKGVVKEGSKNKYLVCKHCGQIWYWERYADAAGSMDERLEKLELS